MMKKNLAALIFVPDIPTALTCSVTAVTVLATVDAIIFVSKGAWGAVMPLAIAAASYWFVYRKLPGNIEANIVKAKTAALMIAVAFGALTVATIAALQWGLFVISATAGLFSAYAFVQLKQLADPEYRRAVRRRRRAVEPKPTATQ